MIDRETLTEIVERVLDETDEPLAAWATDPEDEEQARLAEQLGKLANHTLEHDPEFRAKIVEVLVNSWRDALHITTWQRIDWHPLVDRNDPEES